MQENSGGEGVGGPCLSPQFYTVSSGQYSATGIFQNNWSNFQYINVYHTIIKIRGLLS